MTQTLYTALGSMLAHQQKMNVIANNVANTNTIGYKRNAVHFSTVYDFVMQGGMGPSGVMGSANPIQVGAGVKTKEISTDYGQGGAQITGRSTDVMIQGNGFFIIEDNILTGGTSTESFQVSRQGNFSLDSEGFLVNAEGKFLRGSASLEGNDVGLLGYVQLPLSFQIAKHVDVNTNVLDIFYAPEGTSTAQILADSGFSPSTIITNAELRSFTIGPDGALSLIYSNNDRISVRTDAGNPAQREIVHYPYEGGAYAASTFQFGDNQYGGMVAQSAGNQVFTGGTVTAQNGMTGKQLQIQMVSVGNPEGLVQEGKSLYLRGVNSGEFDFGVPNLGTRGYLVNGALESSNVDIMDEFSSMILTQRGLEAASRLVRTQSEMLQTILAVKQ